MMMLKPTNNLEILNERLDVIEFCADPVNKDFVQQILDHMRNVKGVLVKYDLFLSLQIKNIINSLENFDQTEDCSAHCQRLEESC
jgi:uncharacterized protein YjgD (DUF1641 family)